MSLLLLNGDAREIPLADGSVHMVVTSPPYFGLRRYEGVSPGIWGGEPDCAHDRDKAEDPSSYCRKCGAWLGSLGNEPSVDQYVANIVEIFREVWRVLRPDGTCWLNLGDSYAGSGGAGGDYNEGGLREGQPRYKSEMKIDRSKRHSKRWGGGNIPSGNGLKPKDLIGVPWRVAFALQADGWYLRSDIIWSKPNPMPESVKDRPSKSHEYIFLLTKSERYFYDADAIREPLAESTLPRLMCGVSSNNKWIRGAPGSTSQTMHQPRSIMGYSLTGKPLVDPAGRNRRTVWTISPEPYRGSHFATYPPALVEPCIKAGTSEAGCCPRCGAPWMRVVNYKANYEKRELAHAPNNTPSKVDSTGWRQPTREFLGFRPTCTCYGEHDDAWPDDVDAWPRKPCVVFDPFVGSGTTLLVARALGRSAVGIDLSYPYLHDQARKRLSLDALDEWQTGRAAAKTEMFDLPLFSGNGKRHETEI